jgi:hypothetical protein
LRDSIFDAERTSAPPTRIVVAQVEFERHILKPGLLCKGEGLKAGDFKLWVNRVQLAPPHRMSTRSAPTEASYA